MTNIALRDYHRKIEHLIETHEIEPAISHCINILQRYPKDIATYRKLGKIFLEKPKFEVSEEIFNFVLSVFPDDFVANVGLSFIAEQDKRWDDAIKFMECAFEIQPANDSLQDELKRLYNKRDGFEPPKIRLTRGALIKMYARSNLYRQAIAEIRLGLYEKPNRIDYKLTLVNMLWKSGKRIDAVQTCVEIISSLPYCWDANYILHQAFLDFNKESTDNHYKTRLVELDPYFSFFLPSTRDINDIPDIAIQINDDISQIKDNDSFDWEDFFEKTWAEDPNAIPDKDSQSVMTDWDAILDEAVNKANAADNPGNPESNVESNPAGMSKKEVFINKLQKRSAMKDEESLQDDTAVSGSEISNEGQTTAGKIEETPSPAVTIDDQIDSDDSPVFPPISDESGLVDHDAPVMNEPEKNKQPIVAAWAHDIDSEPPAEKAPLDDTQQIRLLSDAPDEILLQSRKAMEGGNFQFALKGLHKLSEEDDSYLEDIRNILEDACKDHPHESDLWLALGMIYQRLDLNEKALEVFIRAQKQISL